MAHGCPDIDDDGLGWHEQGSPGGVGQRSDQDITLGQAQRIAWIGHHPGAASCHPGTAGKAADDITGLDGVHRFVLAAPLAHRWLLAGEEEGGFTLGQEFVLVAPLSDGVGKRAGIGDIAIEFRF